MADLARQVKTFLEAEGYTVSERRELFVGSRRTLAEDNEYIYVWVPANYVPSTFRSREGGFLSRFKEAADDNPIAPKFMVVPTVEGLSREFREGARQWYRVNIRTPVQFFDTNFKWDTSPEAPSAAKELKKKGEERGRKRVPQPYVAEQTGESRDDLLGDLRLRFRDAGETNKSVQFVIGPAGIGKSYLFDVLFAELHEAFMEYKTRGGPPAPRPLPLIPEYIPMADSKTVKSLLAAYLQTDFARPLRRTTFEWSMTNGYAIWMLDGLDEVISRDSSFFDYLLDLLTLPGASQPKILICVRDALATTHEPFREFLEEYPNETAVYRLAKWEEPSKRRFAELTLGSSAQGFLGLLRERTSLNQLASTPYYCHLLSEQFVAGQLRSEYSEISLLEHALASLIDRDYQKRFIDKDIVSPNEVVLFLEAVASEDFEGGFRGVIIHDAQEWAGIVLPVELEKEERERLSGQMVNLGVFSQGSPGYIRFSQEILEHYLLGKRLISLFQDQGRGDAFVRELAQGELPNDWLTLRLIADHIRSTNQFQNLKDRMYQAVAYSVAFKNIVKIASLCTKDPAALRDAPFERHDLSGIVFRGLDFQGVSFRGCNLTDTEFPECDMRKVDLSEATLKNTAFESLRRDALYGTRIGDLAKFFSMRVDRGRVIFDHSVARKWFQDRMSEHAPTVEPCSAALQLRHLFNKFVYPDGTARRSALERSAMLSGKQFHSSPGDVLDAAIRHGYFHQEERFRNRVHRPEGGLYSECVEFATSLRLTSGIKAALDDVCDREGCSHIPTVA